jgi:hypothetical protein
MAGVVSAWTGKLSAIHFAIPPSRGRTRVIPRPLELKRHPGARGFVGSGAVDDQLAIAGDLREVLIERLGRDPSAARNGVWGGDHVQRGAEVDDRDILPSVELALELLRRDAGDPKLPEKEPATQVLQQRM